MKRPPRLSWLVNSSRRGDLQTACQILVASSESILARDSGDLWDSGRIEGGDPIGVVIRGVRSLRASFVIGRCAFWTWMPSLPPGASRRYGRWDCCSREDWRGDWIGYDKMRMEMPAPANLGDVKGIRQLYLPPPVLFAEGVRGLETSPSRDALRHGARSG